MPLNSEEPTRTVLADGVVEYRDAQGRPHRLDGPALERPGGYEAWYHHGQVHRLDGPARVYPDGFGEWWINGVRREDLEEKARMSDLLPPTRTTHCASGVVEYSNPNGLRHRLNGPAFVYPGGTEEWWFRGALHRVGGPAVTDPDGYEAWCHHGLLHRVDGPARTLYDGTTEWWVYGERREDLEQEANKDD